MAPLWCIFLALGIDRYELSDIKSKVSVNESGWQIILEPPTIITSL